MAREMKHSGVQWIGEFPSDWSVRKIKHICELTSGTTPKSEITEYWDGDIKWITPADFKTSTKWVLQGRRNITSLGKDAGHLNLFPKFSVVFSKRAPIGQVSITLDKLCINQGCFGCIVNDRVVYDYFYYLLSSFTEQFELLGTGTTFKEISASNFVNFALPIPTISEQKAIADYLDAKCAEIDGLLTDLDKEVKTLNEYKKSIISEKVTHGLNPSVNMKDSGIPWAPEIPIHWKVMANKYLMHKVKEIVPLYEGQDIISLSMNGVIVRDLDAGGKMPATFNGYQHIKPGNLLMCLFDIDVTPRCIGLIRNDGLTSPAYSQFAMKEEAYAPFYYYFYLKMDYAKELVYLSKNMRHSLNEDQFGALPTVVPPMDEQIAIANYLDEKCKVIDESIADKQEQIEKLKAYKASLIYEYVTGKKQVAL